jgi:polysaccharide export outer membrane protein
LYINIKAENPSIVSMFKTSAAAGNMNNNGGNLYLTGYSVDRHGNIRMPYIGEVNVLGYTEDETRLKIESELSKYFKDLEKIFVTVKLAGIQFVITGEIGSPGTINLQQNEVSIVDAIANAGDISMVGDRQNVTVIRNSLDGVKKYKLNLTKIELFESENFYILPKDIIYVPPLKQKSWGTGINGLQTFTTFVTIFSFITSSILLIKTL